jgi:threonine/homoserine/homoserine lactone efflux protein
LDDGRLNGLVSGLGAATADATYGLIAAFGLTFISDILINGRILLGLIGGVFLLYLGITTLRAHPPENAIATARAPRLRTAYLSTFGLTLTNPATIITFTALFAAAGQSALSDGDYGAASVLVLGVFCGSALWWLCLSGAVSLLRGRFDASLMLWVNRASGVIISAFGVAALASTLF